jgi:hypothetical protein
LAESSNDDAGAAGPVAGFTGVGVSERLTNDATVDAALDALKATAATGEVYLREAQSGSVEIKEGAVEAVIARGERGIGIRVLDDQRLGFAYTSDLSAEGIRACVDMARRMSAVTERDDDLALATRPIDDADLDIYQAGIGDRPLSERARRPTATPSRRRSSRRPPACVRRPASPTAGR